VAAAAMAAEGLAAVTGAAMVAAENTRRIAMQSHTPFPSHAAGKGDSFSAYNIMRLPPWFGPRSCDVGTGVGRQRFEVGDNAVRLEFVEQLAPQLF
jgi:hypothetical protein